MLITIEDDLDTLLELLWIREAWNLHPAGPDLPPRLSADVEQRESLSASADEILRWQTAWPEIWDACVQHAGAIRDATDFERLHQTAGSSPERERLLHELFGPSWRDQFGQVALTDAFHTWTLERFEHRSRQRLDSVEEEPERQSLPSLVTAWRAGLTKIVTIPCEGTYTRIIGPHTLLVTERTRSQPDQYSEALNQFR
jgi:hypothetical protein